MRAGSEKIVNGISRWENEGGALCSEWIADRESSEGKQEIIVSAGNAIEKSETPTKPSA
jgi:hypothetical protein